TLSLAVKDQGGGEGRLRRGMAGVQEWPPGLDHRRPFFDENPRQGGYLHLSIPVPQMRSDLPRYVPTSAHAWGQVLMSVQRQSFSTNGGDYFCRCEFG